MLGLLWGIIRYLLIRIVDCVYLDLFITLGCSNFRYLRERAERQRRLWFVPGARAERQDDSYLYRASLFLLYMTVMNGENEVLP
jgi:hypothetical protein